LEVIVLENCVKAILYCYPRLGGIEEGYLQHIRNKAMLSADGRESAQKVAEYLATEIIQKALVRELKDIANHALSNLTTEENLLLDVRYFGKLDRVKRAFAHKFAGIADDQMRTVAFWSERTYFRKQKKLLAKLVSRFNAQGLDRQRFLKEFVSLDGIGPIFTYIELGKDLGLEKKERAFLQFLAEIRK
jgi:hypothetical protein